MAFADIRLGPQPSMFHNLIVFTDSRAIDAKYDMGVDTVTDKPTATPETEWNEARIESSMAQLQEMHARLSSLRDAVSRLVDPMLIQQTSPEKLYTHFARNITTTRTEIQDFARLLQHDRTKELFQRAEESRSQKSEDIRGWRVTEHEDWLDVRIVDTPMKTRMDGTVGSDQDISLDLTVEELRATIERFQKNRPGIDCSLDEGSETFTMNLPPPAGIHFILKIHNEASTLSRYTAACKETSKMHAAIIRHVNSLATKQNLEGLLDLLASYANFKKEPCFQCGRLMDRNAQFPLLRIETRSRDTDGHIMTTWQPTHFGCG